jgi:CHAT domain-containing protein
MIFATTIRELQQQAISGKNNSVAWLGMIYDFQAQRFQLRPMGHSLYNGSSGVALFLAALASVTNKAEFGDLALGSLQSLRQGLQEQDPELKQPFLKHIGMGGATGLASIVYTFVRIAGFLSEPKLIDDARKISFWLKVDASAVEEAGIIKGAAGTILSLLALYKVTQESETLEQAIAWGNYLLDQRVTTDTNSKIWKNVEEESLTGFSQGIAGIAYALLQLYATTKNSDFLSAAKEAIAYEQSYSMATDNLSPLASWCYGLPGIVLARLGSLSILNTEEIHQEIEIALPKIQQPSLKALDNLCCGNFADIEVLLVAAEQLSRPEFLETARQQTALVLHIGEGNSGDISADVSGAVILDDADSVGLSSRITNQALSPAVGNSGDINIKAESLTVKQGSFLNASISGRGNSGNILVDVKGGVIFEGEGSEFFSGIGNQVLSLGVGNSGDINIKAESLILGQGNDLNASTLGRGNGGDIFVDVSGAVIINADGGIFSVVRSSAIGNGGNINIKAESLKIRQSGALNTFTLGRGNAGNISVDVKGAVIVDGNNTDFNSGIATIVTESAIGNGGDISIKAGSLTLTQGGLLSASTEGRGSAGNIFVDVKGAVSLDGIDSRGFSSGIDTQVFPLAVGDGGDISIKAESLAITQGGFLSTTTSGEENSGNISVDVSGAVTLDGMGSSDFSRITTQVAESGIGNSGDINLKAESLTITQEAFVSTATFAQGNGGDIGISLTMPNSRLTLSDEAAIAANTLGQGKGGNIQIEAFKSVNLTNDSQISVNSEGEGNAGELGIKTGSLNLQGRSRLLADTFSSEGGNIQLQVRDILLLRNNSSISTTAGQQGTGGNGGNIDIGDAEIASYQQAASLYKQAATKSISAETGVQAQLNRLSLLIKINQLTQAQSLVPQIESKLKDLPTTQTTIYARINFAQSLVCLNQYSGTNTPELKDVAKNLIAVLQQAKSLSDERAESYAFGYLGWLYEQNQQFSEAIALTQKALFSAQAIQATDMIYQWQWQLGHILKAQGNIKAAIAAYNEAIVSLQSLRLDMTAINSQMQFSFREKVEPVYRQLVESLLQTEVSSNLKSNNLQKARTTIESLQLAEIENFLREPCLKSRVEIDKIVDRNDSTAAVIYPILLEKQLAIILKLPRQEELHYYATAISQEQVESTILKLQKSLPNVTQASQVKYLSQQVYDWLIRPLEADLNSNIETLVFVLDGSLRNIPMSVLYDEQQKKYLVEKYAIALAPGLQLVEPKPLRSSSQIKVLAAGISEKRLIEGREFAPLKNVKKELASIQVEIPKSEELLDSKFTKKNLQNKLRSADFSVVHLATHSQFSSNLEKTFIVTWDQLLNIEDLVDLLKQNNSNGSNYIELLVLSSCETAVGDRQASLGLAGIAVKAGAESTIASLWSIDDFSTSEIMNQLYQELNKGSTRAKALRQAQLAILKKEKRPLRRPMGAPLSGNFSCDTN